MKFPLLLALMLALSCQIADARIKRSQTAKVRFKEQPPYPSGLSVPDDEAQQVPP